MEWFKLASGFHRNPRALRAGPEARDLYLLILCLNADREFDGVIPPQYSDPDYLGIQLGYSPLGQEDGHSTPHDLLVTLRNVGLVTVEENGSITLPDYQSSPWRCPVSNRNRQKRWRERQPKTETKSNGITNHNENVTRPSVTVTKRNDIEREKRERREETKTERERSASPPPRLSKKALVLAKHREAATLLWQLQEQIRKAIDPHARGLGANDERLTRIAERLESSTVADCEYVLSVYEAEAKSKGSITWLNGETNWISKNFDRALGQSLARGSPNGNGVGVKRHHFHDGKEDYGPQGDQKI